MTKTLEQTFEEFQVVALRVKAERDKFRDALVEVRELIEGYVDVVDGDYGQPAANKAMKAVSLIDGVL